MGGVNLHAGLTQSMTNSGSSIAIIAMRNAIEQLHTITVVMVIINLVGGCFLSHNIKLFKMVKTQRKNAIYQWSGETTSGQR